MSGGCQRICKFHHVIGHAKANLSARGITVCEVAIFVRQNCSKSLNPKVVQDSNSQDEDPLRRVARFFLTGSSFINSDLGSRRYPNLIDRARSNIGCYFFGQSPETRRFFELKESTGIARWDLDEDRLEEFVNRDNRHQSDKEQELHRQSTKLEECVEHAAGHGGKQDSDKGKRHVVIPARE